jgi:hypothetical protein
MYRQYKTNSQAWNEVANSFKEADRRTAICKAMFGQENLYGLSEEQKEAFWQAI